MRSWGAGGRARGGAAIAVAAALLCSAATAFAEGAEDTAASSERREPLIGVYLQPIFSATLPTRAAASVVDVYGSIQPTGAVGVTIHAARRFTLGFDLEMQGWRGELPAYAPTLRAEDAVGAAPMRFLNYWIHVRARTMFVTRGRFQLHADAVVGLAVGREDGDRFRAEGIGTLLGVGPVATVSLGNYVALSFSAMLEGGWIFYDIESPQAAAGETSYMLTWPRVLIGIGLHGYLALRNARRAPRVDATTASPDQTPAPAEVAAPEAAPAEAAPSAPPPAQEPMQQPW